MQVSTFLTTTTSRYINSIVNTKQPKSINAMLIFNSDKIKIHYWILRSTSINRFFPGVGGASYFLVRIDMLK